MNNSQEILNELKEISPFLAGLEKMNVFLVPDGYFDDLSERLSSFAIFNDSNEFELNATNVQEVPDGYFNTLSTNILAKIKKLYPETQDEELSKLSPMLYSLKSENVFGVPPGYFDNLSKNILKKIKNITSETRDEELLNLSATLYSLRNENVFEIPAGYFDTVSVNILDKIEQVNPETAEEELRNISTTLYSLKDKNVLKVPDGYFDTLSTNILAKTKEQYLETADEELRNLSPMLYTLKNEIVFTVPDGYFENFSNNVIEKVNPVKARVVTMKPRNSWLRIAAAAVVTGAIAITSLQIFNTPSNHNDQGISTTASTTVPGYIKESFQFKTEKQIDAGIAKLSDDDIVKYLEKNGSVLDNDLLLKNTDVSELPSQEDYLIDENTLNTYLDKIDQKGHTN
ncbi:MAG: hypothetical protein ABI691_10395 [Ginsengibacter sp.]